MSIYVRFLYRGIFVSETDDVAINHKDPMQVVCPKNAYGFRFFEKAECIIDGEKLTGEAKNFSPTYYVAGDVLTLEYIKQNMPNEKILISNMECNKWDKVINVFGSFFPFKDNDILIKART